MAYLVVEKQALLDLANIACEAAGVDRELLDETLPKLGLVDRADGVETCAGAVKSGG